MVAKVIGETQWYPDAEKIVLVMDNLNTHDVSSFYKVFEPEEARRLTERFEIHFTPKHGSWLNVAKIELSVLKGQCLKERIDNIETLSNEVEAWMIAITAVAKLIGNLLPKMPG